MWTIGVVSAGDGGGGGMTFISAGETYNIHNVNIWFAIGLHLVCIRIALCLYSEAKKWLELEFRNSELRRKKLGLYSEYSQFAFDITILNVN